MSIPVLMIFTRTLYCFKPQLDCAVSNPMHTVDGSSLKCKLSLRRFFKPFRFLNDTQGTQIKPYKKLSRLTMSTIYFSVSSYVICIMYTG